MQWLSPVLLAIQVVSSLSIIVLVLLQQGKGADMGSSFGGGSAGSLFGATGAANFLSRTTKWAAIIFFASTAGLAYVAHHPAGKSVLEGGVMQGFTPSPVPAAPGGSAVPTAPGAVPTAPGAAVPAAPAPAPAPAATKEPSTPAVNPAPSAPAASGGNTPAGDAAAPASAPAAPSAAPAGEQSGSAPASSTDKK